MSRPLVCGLAVALAAVISWWMPAMAAQEDVNVAQVDLFTDWACPVQNIPATPIPDLHLSITTTGGPLLVGLNLNIQNPLTMIEADALITPIINGTPQSNEMFRFQIPHGVDRQG